MPLDVPGCTRATMIIVVSISIFIYAAPRESRVCFCNSHIEYITFCVFNSARGQACFDSLVGNQLEVMISNIAFSCNNSLIYFVRYCHPGFTICVELSCAWQCAVIFVLLQIYAGLIIEYHSREHCQFMVGTDHC